MKAAVISAIMVLAMVQLMVKPGQAINCGQVDASLTPCLTYLRQGGTPPPLCCNGVRTITEMATTQADKRVACQCVKDAATSTKMEVADRMRNKEVALGAGVELSFS
ncbi:hypothetical protein RJ639_026458, partial [Escallonia herrerae]